MHIGSRISGSTLVALLAASAGAGALIALTAPAGTRASAPEVAVRVCERPTDASQGPAEEVRREVETLRRELASPARSASADVTSAPVPPSRATRPSAS
jgi:hypothetical protein